MDLATKAAIAFILSRLNNCNSNPVVYDKNNFCAYRFRGKVTTQKVSIESVELGWSLRGVGQNGNYSLFHSDTRSYITLSIDETGISGVDHQNDIRFSAKIEISLVTLVDLTNAIEAELSVC